MSEEKTPAIEFPCDWEYRVFVAAGKADEAGKAVKTAVEQMALAGLLLEEGAVSKSGSYRTLRVTVKVASKDEAEQLGEALKNIPGVKFIL